MSPGSPDDLSARGSVESGPFAGRRRPWLIGMVHLRPLPGSPRYGGSLDEVFDRAIKDLDALKDGGADGAIVENYGDAPFLPDRVPPATIAAMTAAAALLRANAPDAFLLGINVLRNDAAAAMSIATVIGAAFIRVNVHVGAAITDQGIIAGMAHETSRLREGLRSRVRIFADAGVKHATALGGRGVEEEARDAVERGLADGILLTGPRTGSPVDVDAVISVRRVIPGVPLLAASGITPELAPKLAPHCDGFVVGTWIKREGRIGEPVDPERVRALNSLLRRIRA
jgi:hypothetical protein